MKLVIRTTRETNQIHNLLHRTTNIRIIDSTSWSIIRIYNFLQTSKFKRNKVTLDEIRSGFKTPRQTLPQLFSSCWNFKRCRPRKWYVSLETARPFLLPFHWKQRISRRISSRFLPPLLKKKKENVVPHIDTRYSLLEWRVSIYGQTRANPRRITRWFLEEDNSLDVV